MADDSPLTLLVQRMESGERIAAEELFPLVYQDLRRRAASCLERERSDHTLQATALVNEAYVKMCGGREVGWQSRAHFYNAAAEAMRKILVDHARGKNARKRGRDRNRVDLDRVDVAQVSDDMDVEGLDAALIRLKDVDARRHQVVMLRYFSGLTEEQVAQVLDVAVKTVQRDWKTAKIFLLTEIKERDREQAEPG